MPTPDGDTRAQRVAHLLCLASLLLGMLLVIIGTSWTPQGYTFDPLRPAREMETIEVRYAAATARLQNFLLGGIILLSLSGLIVTAAVTAQLVGDTGVKYDTLRERRYEAPTDDRGRRAEQRVRLSGAAHADYGTEMTRGGPAPGRAADDQSDRQRQEAESTH